MAMATGCSNPDCDEVVVSVAIGKYSSSHPGGPYAFREAFLRSQLKPESSAKVLPAFVPRPIVEDYEEACRILRLSPKASATLARRCVQGMIRDFCKISRNRLIDEIAELRQLATTASLPKGVTDESIEAIDAIRKIGNIGAHMEKDINVIVDVDPNEALLLVKLIETLVDDWYVSRHNREQRFSQVLALADKKPKSLTKDGAEKAEPQS